MVKLQTSNLISRVRFPSGAPSATINCYCSLISLLSDKAERRLTVGQTTTCDSLAQSVEHLTFNEDVPSSILG